MNDSKRIHLPALNILKKLIQYTIPLLLPGIAYYFATFYLIGRANYYQIDPDLLSVQLGDLIVTVLVTLLVATVLVGVYFWLIRQRFNGKYPWLKKLISALEILSVGILILIARPLAIFSGKYFERTDGYSVISFRENEYRLIQSQGDSLLVIPIDKQNKLQPDKVTYLQKSHKITLRYHRR